MQNDNNVANVNTDVTHIPSINCPITVQHLDWSIFCETGKNSITIEQADKSCLTADFCSLKDGKDSSSREFVPDILLVADCTYCEEICTYLVRTMEKLLDRSSIVTDTIDIIEVSSSCYSASGSVPAVSTLRSFSRSGTHDYSGLEGDWPEEVEIEPDLTNLVEKIEKINKERSRSMLRMCDPPVPIEINEENEGKIIEIVSRLRKNLPCAFVACTVRNEQTFSFFLNELKQSNLQYEDITSIANELVLGPRQKIYYPNRELLKLLYVTSSTSPTTNNYFSSVDIRPKCHCEC